MIPTVGPLGTETMTAVIVIYPVGRTTTTDAAVLGEWQEQELREPDWRHYFGGAAEIVVLRAPKTRIWTKSTQTKVHVMVDGEASFSN
jgi:hypothetical protein